MIKEGEFFNVCGKEIEKFPDGMSEDIYKLLSEKYKAFFLVVLTEHDEENDVVYGAGKYLEDTCSPEQLWRMLGVINNVIAGIFKKLGYELERMPSS